MSGTQSLDTGQFDPDLIAFVGLAHLVAERDGISVDEASARLGNLFDSPEVQAQVATAAAAAKAEADAAAAASDEAERVRREVLDAVAAIQLALRPLPAP